MYMPNVPSAPGTLAWAAKRIEEILRREAEQKRRRQRQGLARRQAAEAEPDLSSLEYLRGTGGLLDPDVWGWGRSARPPSPAMSPAATWAGGGATPAMQPAPTYPPAPLAYAMGPRPTVPFGMAGGAWGDSPPSMIRPAGGMAPPMPGPFPLPLPLPPVAIPGTPENDEFVRGIISLYQGIFGGGGKKDDDGCAEEWRKAFEKCDELLEKGGRRGLTGGYANRYDCARGLVSERCGGNPIDHGPQRPRRRR